MTQIQSKIKPQIRPLLNLYKEEGETPLETINRFKEANPEYKDIPMTYAGRLDPMAEGVLLVLAGDECKNKEKYLGLNKEYEIEVLFGFETDTYDILGFIQKSTRGVLVLSKEVIGDSAKKIIGKFVQEYPPFSSKTVDGTPLFAAAKSGNLPDEMPTKEVEIFDIKVGEMKNIGAGDLLQNITSRISNVKGDFRQGETLQLWRENLQNSIKEFQTIKFTISCSSGTYMRSFAHSLGKTLGIPALVFSIKRMKVGDFCNTKIIA